MKRFLIRFRLDKSIVEECDDFLEVAEWFAEGEWHSTKDKPFVEEDYQIWDNEDKHGWRPLTWFENPPPLIDEKQLEMF